MRRYYSYPKKAEPLQFEMAPVAHKFTIVVIILSGLLIFGNLAANAYFDPKAVAEREMERITQDYYENYFYDNFIDELRVGWEKGEKIVYEEADFKWPLDESVDDEMETFEDYVSEGFHEYVNSGFPQVYLRKLLLFDDGRHANSRQIFSGQYVCNTNHTSVKITPHSPFGKKDYTVEYNYECEWNK